MNDEKLKRAIELQKEIKELEAHLRLVTTGGDKKLPEGITPISLYEIGEGNQKPDMLITTSFSGSQQKLYVELLPIPLSIIMKVYCQNVAMRIDRLKMTYENL